jgi:hypothetical protein
MLKHGKTKVGNLAAKFRARMREDRLPSVQQSEAKMKKKIFDELVRSLNEAKKIARGKAKPSRTFVVERPLREEKKKGNR